MDKSDDNELSFYDKFMINYLKILKINRPFLSLIVIFLTSIFLFNFIPFVSADVISLNAGGSTNLSVSTDRYIEGFFFGGSCGDGVVDTSLGEQCDGGNLNGQSCTTVSGGFNGGTLGCTSLCQFDTSQCTTPSVTPPAGGGGGAGGSGVPPTALNILVNPTEFNVNLLVNTTTERTIKVTNLGTSTVTASVSQLNLGSHVILENTSLTIPAGQSVDLKVVFVALSEPGIFTGKILIDGVAVLVSLNVKTEFLLFDSNIVVLNPDYTVRQGEELRTLVTLIPLGDPERLDVTLNFVIKDYANKIYLTKTETLLVENQVDLRRNFDTGILPPGDYIVGLELIYPNGVAPSSAHFIVTPPISFLGRIILFLIIMILVILIIIIVILIRRRRKKKPEEEVVEGG